MRAFIRRLDAAAGERSQLLKVLVYTTLVGGSGGTARLNLDSAVSLGSTECLGKRTGRITYFRASF